MSFTEYFANYTVYTHSFKPSDLCLICSSNLWQVLEVVPYTLCENCKYMQEVCDFMVDSFWMVAFKRTESFFVTIPNKRN